MLDSTQTNVDNMFQRCLPFEKTDCWLFEEQKFDIRQKNRNENVASYIYNGLFYRLLSTEIVLSNITFPL